jgi:hypothetical protein
MSKTDRANWINENTEYTVTTSSTTDSSATNESENPEQAAAQAQLRGSVGGVQGILQIADNFKKGIINEWQLLQSYKKSLDSMKHCTKYFRVIIT